MSRFIGGFVAIALLAQLTACGAGERAQSGTVLRDSAGITIVENTMPVWREAEGWWVAAEPLVEIGMLDGPEEDTFNRVSGVLVSPDGSLYVVDGGDKVIKAFDVDGRYLFQFGGEGEGPGEFGAPGAFALLGDTIVVHDWRLLKLAYFDRQGRLLRTERSELSPGGVGFLSHLHPVPGGYLAELGIGCRLPAPKDLRPKWKAFVLDRQAGIRDSTVNLHDRQQLALYGERFCSSMPAPAGRRHSLAVQPGGLVAYGNGQSYEIRLFRVSVDPGPSSSPPLWDRLRSPERIIRKLGDATAFSAEDRAAYDERWLEPDPANPGSGDRLKAIEAALDSLGHPSTWPAFDQLLWDDGGNLWVRRGGADEAAPRLWDVFDSEGRLLGEVELPGALEVSAIVGSRVIGTVRDELDVERVWVYALEPRQGVRGER